MVIRSLLILSCRVLLVRPPRFRLFLLQSDDGLCSLDIFHGDLDRIAVAAGLLRFAATSAPRARTVRADPNLSNSPRRNGAEIFLAANP